MKRICILSDTHGFLRDEVKTELAQSDLILHAGDIDNRDLFQTLRGFGELYAVRGNNDRCLPELPVTRSLSVEGVRFFIVHNIKDIPRDLTDTDIVVYGHTHQYYSAVSDGILFLNPGSCGKRRFHYELTYCRMVIEKDAYRYDKIVINKTEMRCR